MCHNSPGHLVQDNPFATRFVRPGALPYLFEEGHSLAELLDRLKACSGWGQIIGPHGSGKSTLLSVILAELQQQGVNVVHIALHEGERFDRAAHQPEKWAATTQVVIDGYEQLGRFTRWRLCRYCRRRGAGLLVTAHTDVGLPTLCETRIERAIARQLIAQLLAEANGQLEETAITACLARHPHDLREAFFELYDLYELQGISQFERPNSAT